VGVSRFRDGAAAFLPPQERSRGTRPMKAINSRGEANRLRSITSERTVMAVRVSTPRKVLSRDLFRRAYTLSNYRALRGNEWVNLPGSFL
jgi:hypothetical protein